MQFGETVEGYNVPVVNEREIRAAAGIVFLFAFIAFMNAFLVGNNEPTKLMVTAFLVDFLIRVLIAPKYAPSMILGRWIVNNQAPEYVGAAQKRWAWGFGLMLASVMFYLVVLNDVRGPVNIMTCGLCLVLLYFEAVFGICIGCKVYNLFNREAAQYCPGGYCETPRQRADIQRIGKLQTSVFGLFIVAVLLAPVAAEHMLPDNSGTKDCTVPQFAIDLDHVDQWKLHNGCP
ncbi:MAG TPA: DUF4395 domain-containing protein [Oceanospirillaceae bacterium]|nr:DUF4395 domain-containing protein [Oceanospirillaceae bacterium]